MTTKIGEWTKHEAEAAVPGVRCAQPEQHTIDADHGARDEKGRAVGGFAVVVPCGDWQWVGDRSEFTADPSGRWAVRVYAARDGKKFGAIPRSTYYADLSVAKSAARAKLVAQGARYAKAYGRKP